MARDARPLTRLAEIATVLALVVALIGLVVMMRDRPTQHEGMPDPIPGSGQAPIQPDTAAGSTVSTEPAVDPVSPSDPEPAPAESDTRQTPAPPGRTPAPVEAPREPPVAAAATPISVPMKTQAAFLLGHWRLSGESCADARKFKITGDVLEVLESNGELIYSGGIRPTGEMSARISGGSGGHFVRQGRRLNYDPDSGSSQIFELCD
ncbi:MAG TPA: hypothetical protein VGB04_05550 [Allosphingosinicella sp.]|jgi:hypothetical protein